MTKISLLAAASAVALSIAVQAHDDERGKARIDDHAPIGVMADHYHKKGEWMASARWMNMGMDDAANTMMGPQSMDMDMAMVGVMYAPSDDLTLGAMIGYSDMGMDMIMNGMDMGMTGKGITDLKLNAIVPLHKGKNSRFHATFGTSIPVGTTDETNAMGALLPLTMQPGNDTWGLMPSVTYSYFASGWSAGFQAGANFWIGDASTGEKPGDRWYTTGWASKTLTDNLSLSARLSYEDQSSWDGVNPMLGGARERLMAYAGANIYVFDTHRLGVEFGFPVSENQGTNNLETGTSIMVGWQKAF